jgi:hypothetical protein
MNSLKTTLCGLISAIGATLVTSDNPTLQIIGQFLLPIGTLLTGYFAQDKK